MKRILNLIIALNIIAVVFIAAKPSTKDNSTTIEELINYMVDCIKTKNKDLFKKIVITDVEITDMVMKSELTDKEKEKAKEEILREKPFTKTCESFDEVLNTIKEKQINISEFKVKEFKIDAFSEVGVFLADINIVLSNGKENYSIRTRELLKTAKGWRLSRKVVFESPSVNEENDGMNYDNTYNNLDTAAFNQQLQELMRQLQLQQDSMLILPDSL